MRKVPGLSAGEVRPFIPEAFDNREDNEPITIWIKVPSEGDKRNIFRAMDAGIDSGGIKVSVEHALAAQDRAIEMFVVKVDNYTANTGDPITDGAGLLKHGEDVIVREVAAAVLESAILSEQDKKKPGESLDFTPAATAVSTGVAAIAGPAVSTRAEVAV